MSSHLSLLVKRANGMSGQASGHGTVAGHPCYEAVSGLASVESSGTSWSLADPLGAAARRKARGTPSLCFSAFL